MKAYTRAMSHAGQNGRRLLRPSSLSGELKGASDCCMAGRKDAAACYTTGTLQESSQLQLAARQSGGLNGGMTTRW
jgi:hypothetical protein